MLLARRQPFGGIDMDILVRETDGRADCRESPQRARRVARLLAELSLRTDERILIRCVELARGNLERHASDGITILTDEDNLLRRQQRNDSRCTRMLDPLPRRLLAIR